MDRHPFCNLLKKTKADLPNSSSTNFLDKINSLSVYIAHGFLTRISKPTQHAFSRIPNVRFPKIMIGTGICILDNLLIYLCIYF